MAEGDCSVYNYAKYLLFLGDIHFDSDTFKIVLLGSGYSFSPDGNNGYSSISAQEITASGYTAGGKTLTGATVTQNDTGDYAKWDETTDPQWTSLASTTIANAVIIDSTITSPTASPLVCHFVVATNSNGGNYTLSFNAGGILQMA